MTSPTRAFGKQSALADPSESALKHFRQTILEASELSDTWRNELLRLTAQGCSVDLSALQALAREDV